MLQLNLSGLLSVKPKIYVCNVDENGLVKGNKHVDICLKKYVHVEKQKYFLHPNCIFHLLILMKGFVCQKEKL